MELKNLGEIKKEIKQEPPARENEEFQAYFIKQEDMENKGWEEVESKMQITLSYSSGEKDAKLNLENSNPSVPSKELVPRDNAHQTDTEKLITRDSAPQQTNVRHFVKQEPEEMSYDFPLKATVGSQCDLSQREIYEPKLETEFQEGFITVDSLRSHIGHGWIKTEREEDFHRNSETIKNTTELDASRECGSSTTDTHSYRYTVTQNGEKRSDEDNIKNSHLTEDMKSDTEENSPDSAEHKRFHSSEKKYQCSFCYKGFSHRVNLRTHTRIHTGEKPFTCCVCNKGFAQSSALKGHVRTHTHEKPYSCSLCKKAFSCKSALTDHLRTHSGEKPYPCSYCSKRFSNNGNLAAHLRTHTGDKPYQCTVCSKAFVQRGNLMDHMKTHSREKPYQCSYCNTGFSNMDDFSHHVRSHEAGKHLECSVCKKLFSQKGNLTTHMRTHSGEKPYQCSFCDQRFSCSGTLTTHTRIHTGERPYTCSMCDKGFAQNGGLRRHMKIHLKGKL